MNDRLRLFKSTILVAERDLFPFNIRLLLSGLRSIHEFLSDQGSALSPAELVCAASFPALPGSLGGKLRRVFRLPPPDHVADRVDAADPDVDLAHLRGWLTSDS